MSTLYSNQCSEVLNIGLYIKTQHRPSYMEAERQRGHAAKVYRGYLQVTTNILILTIR